MSGCYKILLLNLIPRLIFGQYNVFSHNPSSRECYSVPRMHYRNMLNRADYLIATDNTVEPSTAAYLFRAFLCVFPLADDTAIHGLSPDGDSFQFQLCKDCNVQEQILGYLPFMIQSQLSFDQWDNPTYPKLCETILNSNLTTVVLLFMKPFSCSFNLSNRAAFIYSPPKEYLYNGVTLAPDFPINITHPEHLKSIHDAAHLLLGVYPRWVVKRNAPIRMDENITYNMDILRILLLFTIVIVTSFSLIILMCCNLFIDAAVHNHFVERREALDRQRERRLARLHNDRDFMNPEVNFIRPAEEDDAVTAVEAASVRSIATSSLSVTNTQSELYTSATPIDEIGTPLAEDQDDIRIFSRFTSILSSGTQPTTTSTSTVPLHGYGRPTEYVRRMVNMDPSLNSDSDFH